MPNITITLDKNDLGQILDGSNYSVSNPTNSQPHSSKKATTQIISSSKTYEIPKKLRQNRQSLQ